MNILRKLFKSISILVYIICGKKPWKIGYNEYKIKKITKYIAESTFNVNELPKNYGYRLDERIIEYPWFFSRLPKDGGVILDAGSVLNYDYLLDNVVFRNKDIFISTLYPEKRCFWKKCVSYVYEDLRYTCFKNNYFNWIVSLSTIEHIGMDNTFLYTRDETKKEAMTSAYLSAVKEYYRILKKGGILYLSFPFGEKKNHGWFQIFDSKMVNELIEVFGPASYYEYYFKYEESGWKASTRETTSDATYFDIHKQKKYDNDFAAASRAVACLELIK
jgi:hypothetical protein